MISDDLKPDQNMSLFFLSLFFLTIRGQKIILAFIKTIIGLWLVQQLRAKFEVIPKDI